MNIIQISNTSIPQLQQFSLLQARFAQATEQTYSNYYYGQDAYSSSDYNGNTAQSSGLINSGTIALLGVVVGSLMIFTVLAMRIIKRVKKSKVNE